MAWTQVLIGVRNAKLIKEGLRSFPPLYGVDRALNLWPRRGGSETPKSINMGLLLDGPINGWKIPSEQAAGANPQLNDTSRR